MTDQAPLVLSPSQIDDKSGVPLYQQLYDILRGKIMDGTLGLNTMLPAEQDITKMLGISRITVKRSMNELAVAGLVRRQRGNGTTVIYDASAPAVKGNFDTMIDGLTRMGLETEVQLLDCTIGSASPAIAESLELPIGASVQRIVRLRKLNDEPFSYLVTYIPDDVADSYDDSELANQSLLGMLERAGHAPIDAEQTISALAAEPAIASVLGIAPGSPLLRIHRIMRDAKGRPVQNITANYRADKFEYHMRLTRGDAKQENWKTEK